MSKSILIIIAFFSVVGTTYAFSLDNCTSVYSCEECNTANCYWIGCEAYTPSCQKNGPAESCYEIPCDDKTTTVAPPTTTVPTTVIPTTETTTAIPTTEAPTTEPPTTEPPTTEAPTTEPPTTEAPTTEAPTEPPTTEPPTTEPPTTEPPTTEAPTEPPTTDPITEPTTEPVTPPTTEVPSTTASPPTPSGRHFDAASFFGGMVLAVGIMAVAYAAWRFYKSRNGRSYHTL